MSTTKQASDTAVESDEIAEARAALVAAERRLAELNAETESLALEQAVLRGKKGLEAEQRKAEIRARADELRGRWDGKRRVPGEIYIAQEAVAPARARLAALLDPVLPVAEAERAVEAAAQRAAQLEAEQAQVPAALRDAAALNDVDRQVELTKRSDDLSLLVPSARRTLLRARLAAARAHVAATAPAPGETKSVEHWRWRDIEISLNQAVAVSDREAASAARAASTPVVRSGWQGSRR